MASTGIVMGDANGPNDKVEESVSSTSAPSGKEEGQPDESGAVNSRKCGLRQRAFAAFAVCVAVVAVCAVAIPLVLMSRDDSTSSGHLNVSSPSTANNESISVGKEENSKFVFTKPFEDTPLPSFNADVLQPYRTRQELEDDLTKYAQTVVNEWMESHLNYSSYEEDLDTHSLNMEGDAAATTKTATQKKTKSLTNNQKPSAEEADEVKNDDLFVYASFGIYLLVMDHQGQVVAHARMPEEHHGNTNSGFARIKTIQLTKNHVVAIAGDMAKPSFATTPSPASSISNYQVLVYPKPNADYQPSNSSAELPLLATTFANGYSLSCHYLEASDSIHITTGGDVNSEDLYFEQWQHLGLDYAEHPRTKAQYMQAATRHAKETFIPNYVQGLADQLWSSSGSFMRINNYLPDEFSPELRSKNLMYSGINGYLQITSFLAKDLPTTKGEVSQEIKTSTTTLLTPWATFGTYAVNDAIVLAVKHWPDDLAHRTAFVQLKVDNATGVADLFSIASLEGEGRMDLSKGELRVTMSQQMWYPLQFVDKKCGSKSDPCLNDTNWQQCSDLVTEDYCKSVIKSGCPYEFTCDEDDEVSEESKSTTKNYVAVLDATQPGIMTERGRLRVGEPHHWIKAVHFGDTSAHITTYGTTQSAFYSLKLEYGNVPKVAGSIHELDDVKMYYLGPLNPEGTQLFSIGHGTWRGGAADLVLRVFDVSNSTEPALLTSKRVDGLNARGIAYDGRDMLYKDGTLVIPVNSNGYDVGSFLAFDMKKDSVIDLFSLNIDRPPIDGDSCSCWSYLPLRSLYLDDTTIMGMYGKTVVAVNASNGEELWATGVAIEESVCC